MRSAAALSENGSQVSISKQRNLPGKNIIHPESSPLILRFRIIWASWLATFSTGEQPNRPLRVMRNPWAVHFVYRNNALQNLNCLDIYLHCYFQSFRCVSEVIFSKPFGCLRFTPLNSSQRFLSLAWSLKKKDLEVSHEFRIVCSSGY